MTDVPGTEEEQRLYPASYPVNKWPEEHVIPQFEVLGKDLGLLMKDVVALLAAHIDAYAKVECGAGYNVCTCNTIFIVFIVSVVFIAIIVIVVAV